MRDRHAVKDFFDCLNSMGTWAWLGLRPLYTTAFPSPLVLAMKVIEMAKLIFYLS